MRKLSTASGNERINPSRDRKEAVIHNAKRQQAPNQKGAAKRITK